MKSLFILCGLFFSTQVFAISVELKTVNPKVKSYFNNKFQQEVESKKWLIQAFLGSATKDALDRLVIKVEDVSPEFINGYQPLMFSKIYLHVPLAASGISENELRNLVFHEFGHYVFQEFLVQKKSLIVSKYFEIIRRQGTSSEEFRSLARVFDPAHELAADFFKTQILNQHAKRELSHTFSSLAWANTKSLDPHLVLDPVRHYFWSSGIILPANQELVVARSVHVFEVLKETLDHFSTICPEKSLCSIPYDQYNSLLLSKF